MQKMILEIETGIPKEIVAKCIRYESVEALLKDLRCEVENHLPEIQHYKQQMQEWHTRCKEHNGRLNNAAKKLTNEEIAKLALEAEVIWNDAPKSLATHLSLTMKHFRITIL
jgi:chromosome segregation ATPase